LAKQTNILHLNLSLLFWYICVCTWRWILYFQADLAIAKVHVHFKSPKIEVNISQWCTCNCLNNPLLKSKWYTGISLTIKV